MDLEKKGIKFKIWVDTGLGRIDRAATELEKRLKSKGYSKNLIDFEVKKLIKEMTDELRELRKGEVRSNARR